MRLKPIENPPNILLKLAFWWSKREFGKVIMPFKVIYSRQPKLLWLANKIYQFQEKEVSLAPSLQLLIQTQTSFLNGCAFCNDILLAQAVRKKLGTEKFAALGAEEPEKTEVFTEKERAVIAYVNEYAENRRVSDKTFGKLQALFSETEIVEIVALHAFEQYFNVFAVSLEIAPDGLRESAERGYKRRA